MLIVQLNIQWRAPWVIRSYRVLNALGQSILHAEVDSNGGSEPRDFMGWDTQRWPKGLYTVILHAQIENASDPEVDAAEFQWSSRWIKY